MLIDKCTNTTAQKSSRDHTRLKSGKSLMNVSAYSMQGRRTHMEDFFDIAYQMKPHNQQRTNEWPYEYFYFGIFDGHGGCEAAKFAKQNLLKFITNQTDFWSNNDDDVMRAIRKGYADTHSAMREKMSEWTRTSRVLPSTAGTTASIIFIKNGKFYTGHVGDSRIVISREHPETKQWISHQITEDHKPESQLETERIERAGGEVKSKIGVHRVVWRRPVLNKDLDAKLLACPKPPDFDDCLNQISSYPVSESLVESYQTIPFLAIARSLGDFWSINPYSGQYIVSPEPDVACRPISPNDKCILLATDGLWNVMNSLQAVRALQELKIIKKGKRNLKPYCDEYFTTDNFYDVSGSASKNHALSLVYIAYQIWERRRLRSDNITAVVAMLSDILGPFQRAALQTSSPSKIYTTRASKQLESKNQLSTNESIVSTLSLTPQTNSIVQLGQTYIFSEKIRLNQVPVFYASPGHDEESDFFQKLDNFLVFPPTVLEQEFMFEYGLIEPPKNYLRLSHARCKKLRRNDTSSPDSIIYIKRVSDDPDDRKWVASRKNKSGKNVRDASAQATQCIHDFGQPWDQLKSEMCREFDEEVELVFNWELREDDVVVDDYLDVGEEEGEEKEGDFNDEIDEVVEKVVGGLDDCNDEDDELDLVGNQVNLDLDKGDLTLSDDDDSKIVQDVDNSDDKKTPIKEHQLSSNEASMPQLRCLMNCNGSTPTLRRSTRSGTYLSVTENSKRKVQPSPNLPKSKRRKSHPVHCALAQA